MERDAQEQLVQPGDGLIVARVPGPELFHPPAGLLILPGSGGSVRLVGHLVAW